MESVADGAARTCQDCEAPLGSVAYCRGCVEDYGAEDDLPDVSYAAQVVADWLDRATALGRLTPETIAAFEECLEDIR